MTFSALTWLLLLTLGYTEPDHAFYLSVIEINYDEGTSAELTVKVFSDDLQSALRNDKNLDELPPLDQLCGSFEISLTDYFAEHLKVSLDDKLLESRFESCEIVGETHLLTYALPWDKGFDSCMVTADLFIELFPTPKQHGVSAFRR